MTIEALKTKNYAFKETPYEERNGIIITDDLCESKPNAKKAQSVFCISPDRATINCYAPNSVTILSELYELAKQSGVLDLKENVERVDLSHLDHNILFVTLAVPRPCKLIGSSSTWELLNFVVYKAPPRSKGKKRVLPNSKVGMLSHITPKSPELFKKLSGSKHHLNSTQNIALVGCGSLGSKIGLHLARNGNGPFVFIDNDVFLPHNNARHGLSFAWADNKALLMAFSTWSVCGETAKTARNALEVDYSESRLIIDSTASFSVRSFLMGCEKLPPIISAGLYDQGKSGLLLIESKTRKTRLSDLWAHLYLMSLNDGEIRKILFSSQQEQISTGTPLMRREKDERSASGEMLKGQTKKLTETKFGGMIDAYTISEAEADGVVLPLIYQPRYVELSVQQKLLDQFYDHITKELSAKQKKDLQQKFNSSQIIEETSQRIETIALDILNHYKRFEDTGLKAQVVAPSKYAAVMFQKAFNLQDKIQVEVIISESADKEEDDLLPEHKKEVVKFLADEKHRYGSSLLKREKELIDDFKENPDGVRMLIVVDKLLTGFDAPRNTFLYLAKQLKDHNLLQAIARVNRLFDGDEGKEAKVNGFVIDYSKNAKNLRDAMKLFSNYDPEDIERALLNTAEKITGLERIYQELHGIFNSVRNKQDTEEYIRILEGDIETREHFYELVDEFTRQFSACQMLYDFTQKFDEEKLRRFALDLKRFVELKKIQKIKNAETVDFSKYEDQIRRILDKYVSADYVTELAEPICVSESAEFNAYIDKAERGLSDKSKAEAIAAQTERTIKENYNKDPEFYRYFSEKISRLIAELRSAKEEDVKALLGEVRQVQGQVVDYEDSDIPVPLKENKPLHPYFRNLKSRLAEHQLSTEQLCNVVENIYRLIDKHKIVDWDSDIEVERRVRMEIEDYLFDTVKNEYGAPLTLEEIDAILSMIWDLAVQNKDEPA